MLVAIGLIVILISLAVPTFSALRGSNSVENATNVVSASLARARADAVGLQQVRGIAFFRDAESQRIAVALVQPDDATPWSSTQAYTRFDVVTLGGTVYTCIQNHPAGPSYTPGTPGGAAYWSSSVVAIDLVPDRDQLRLPTGINARGAGNTVYAAPAVILFDEFGQLLVREYVIGNGSDLLAQMDPVNVVMHNTLSQVGIMLFENEAFQAATESAGIEPTNTHRDWIADNATPLLVNRYNGTIVKGE